MIKILIQISLPLIITISLWNCSGAPKENTTSKPDFLASNIDSTVDPSQDFFMYANGGWFKKNPIPETENAWGIGNLVIEEIYTKLKTVCENASSASQKDAGTQQVMIGHFYASAMDTTFIEESGIKPIQYIFDNINNINSTETLIKQVAELHTINVSPAFSMYVGQDAKNSSKYSLNLSQGGLGMPNRDYYLKNDDRTKNIRNEYLKYLTQTFIRLGNKNADKSANEILQLETSLAKASRSLENLRDPYKNYNPKTIADLNILSSHINWNIFFDNCSIKITDSVIVGQPEFFTELGKLIKSTSLDTWKNYLKWFTVISLADKLSSDYADADFAFYRTVLRGTKKQKPRWKRTIDDANNSIGELLGQIFVKEYFSPKAKARYEKLVDDVMLSFKEHIEKLDWMSPETKAKALKKLSTVSKKVGYPDHWKNFEGINISRQHYVLNTININKWWFNYYVNKMGKPVDRTEWEMTPQTYNAYYNPSNNEIVLPAAIFAVAGYSDEELDDAWVYGYAGASTIGHEITHGFDDEGRQFDEEGNLKSWWTTEDEEKFLKKAKMYVKQFNGYVVLDSLHVNGEATLGENIADLGGIVIGLDAFKKTEQYKKGEKIAGLTPLQRYFLGYAMGWLMHPTKESLANQILTDVHAPASWRVNGPFSNVADFYNAFGIKENSPMWKPDSLRVVIW